MTADEECEEWAGWLDIPPKQIIHMTGRVRRVLTRDEVRELLAEGKRIRGEVEARVDAMERSIK